MTMANYNSVTLYVLYSFNKSKEKVQNVCEKNILTENQGKNYFVLGRLRKTYSDSRSIGLSPKDTSHYANQDK